ncbi:beta-phosphoglucomutase [Vulcanibacillus modesticaldus]|uniref:Beta-phosphoglucomutase n=2 Tax=Vulcanibacillus modesticaldus TaxID=337097 RepID=A0A1D2YWP2_9BACI|nr:beta-phosphoglucomutase [Vulcanibacillus modesticaldus]
MRKKSIYPYSEWEIVEESFDVDSNLQDETIFAIGNGYIGMRGNFEEGYSGPEGTSVNGTYLNGFYESEPIIYGEEAYGYAKYSQTMLNVTDGKIIKLYIDDEPFDLFKGKILSYKRILDMKNGVLIRRVTWESATGKRIELHIRRLVSFNDKHLVAISYEVLPLNFDGKITIISSLNGKVQNQVTAGDPRTGSVLSGQVLITEDKRQFGSFGAIKQRTRNTQFTLVCSMENELETDNPYEMQSELEADWVAIKYIVEAKQGKKIQLSKYISYHTSRDYPEEKLLENAKQTVEKAKISGFESLLAQQKQYLEQFWYRTDIEIDGDLALQQSIRFNEFHLLQSVGKDGKTNIGAKGLTGEGYEGHYFWDTETYILPFFLYTNPEISKKLLEYRFNTLNKARERAKELSHKGALYAWRTIDGAETSAYYPAGTAQYHINADIIYALKRYMDATDDIQFFLQKGAEMLFETARLWVDIGNYNPRKSNRFCINDVTGPDEYTAIVNNNVYTNLMAKSHLEYAYKMANLIKEKYPKEYEALVQKIGLSDIEVGEWKKAAELMYIPYDEELGIYPQDDSFLDKAVWDFKNTPEENYPLLLHYHPLVIYRYQVLKQADLVLALFLQGDSFTLAEKKRNFEYYEPITTHDSSLSPCIHSIIAAEIGYDEKAYQYFAQTARMDLDDYNGNVKDGIHSAAMAGAWMSIVYGFAGLRDFDGKLKFNPIIPDGWKGYRFKVTFKARLIELNITKEEVIYKLLEGEPITIYHLNQALTLELDKEVKVNLTPKLEAVIFDLDGVITDTAEYHFLAWKKLADKIGVPFDREFNEKLKGIGRLESLELILNQGNKKLTEQEKLELAKEKNEYYLELIQGITPANLLPGILPLLKELKENGIKIALASASKNAKTVIDKLQIKEYFDYVVDAAKIKKGKPDPEIFMTAAEELNLPYQNCIGIEDAEAGILAIKAAKMMAIGVGKTDSMKEADLIVKDTDELTLELLKQRFSINNKS